MWSDIYEKKVKSLLDNFLTICEHKKWAWNGGFFYLQSGVNFIGS